MTTVKRRNNKERGKNILCNCLKRRKDVSLSRRQRSECHGGKE